MGRHTYTRREFVKGGAAALVGATLALPLTSRKAHALTRGVAVGVFASGNGPLYGDFAELDAYIGLAGGVAPNIAHVYSPWRPEGTTNYLYPQTDNLRLFYDRYPGSMMLWSWEPFGVTLQEINGGVHDAYIDEVAQRIKALGNRVLIRFGHEMNGNWSWPWLNQPPEEYRAAWQRIVTRFRLLGASNAEWIWGPNIMYSNGALDFRPYYPGDAYVDWTGFSGYNWGSVLTEWRTFREIFRYSIGVITTLSSRDIIICETGCHSRGPNGESKGYWFQQTATELKENYPRIKGFVYTHAVDQNARREDADWRVDSPAEALDDWQAFVADPQFKVALVLPRARSDTTTVDITPASAPVITSPANNSFNSNGSITLSGTAEANTTVEIFEDTSKGTTPVDSSGAWSKTLSNVANGSHIYTAKATDGANNTSAPSNACTVIVDTIKPRVVGTSPLAGATGISPRTNVSATFSEAMRRSTISTTTFKLYKLRANGTRSPVAATVTYNATSQKAVLNPNGDLRLGATYKAVVTAGAKDRAGNALDQNPNVSGNQSKTWTFTIRRR